MNRTGRGLRPRCTCPRRRNRHDGILE